MMLSNFAFIKETSNLVFLVFATIKKNYFQKNLWLAAKNVWGIWWDTCPALYAGDVLIIKGISYCRNLIDF